MRNIHEKQSILDDVKKEVKSWQSRMTIISLSPGFGPDFEWAVVEFVPSSEQALIQFQYFSNSETRQMERHEKYSPPFGVKSIDQEERSFNRYLENLLDPTLPHLQAYARQAYATDSDEVVFSEYLLILIVNLYTDTRDQLVS